MAGAYVTGPGPGEMRVLAAKLKVADPQLRRDLRRAFRAEAAPVVRAVRQSILSMPSHHGGDLRADVARTVTSAARITAAGVSVEIVSLGSRMPEGQTTLPRHLDAAKGWAHPVFARGPRFTLGPSRARKWRRRPWLTPPLVHRGAWVWARQMGKPGWFENTITAQARHVQAACQDVLDRARRRLEG